jgi:hypothetical protein
MQRRNCGVSAFGVPPLLIVAMTLSGCLDNSATDPTNTAATTQVATQQTVAIAAKHCRSSSSSCAGTTTTNVAPTISGTPSVSAQVGTAYGFQPTAADANGNILAFSISNKPAWLIFSTVTGQLSGTPSTANVGTYSNILITVSDGKASTSLAAFAIIVTPLTGSATLSWSAPLQNTDGSALSNLGGYRIYYGTNATALTQSVQLGTPGLVTYTVGNLNPGTYYFAIAAYTTTGVQSNLSTVVSTTII